MKRIAWSRQAILDLSRLSNFLADKNPEAAKRAMGAIRHGLRSLAEHPSIGRPVNAMPTEYREWPIAFSNSAYVVFYRVETDVVAILSIRHGREEDYP